MNHHQWSHRLRGHINLKMSIALGAIALAGAFVVKLPAQDKTVDAECGVNDNAASVAQYPESLLPNDPFATGATVAEKDRGPRGVILPPDKLTPKGVTIVATLVGPFVDLHSGKVVNITLVTDTAESMGYSLIKSATYRMDAVVRSNNRNLNGLTLGQTANKLGVKALGEKTPLSVALSNPAKSIYITGDVDAGTLLQEGANWRVETSATTFIVPPVAKKEVSRGGIKVRGAMGGQWLNIHRTQNAKGDDRFIFKTLDAFAKEDYGLLASTYGFSTTFTDARSEPKLYGASLGVQPMESMLRVDVDTPQRSISLQGLVRGTRFIQSGGLGWGVSEYPLDVPPDPRVNRLSLQDWRTTNLNPNRFVYLVDNKHGFVTPSNTEDLLALPPLQPSSRVVIRASAQVAPTATPSGSKTVFGIKVPEIEIVRPITIGPIQLGPNYLPTSSSEHTTPDPVQSDSLYTPGGIDTCLDEGDITIVAKTGVYWAAETTHDIPSLAAHHAWEATLIPKGGQDQFKKHIAKGMKNLKGTWKQDFGVEKGQVDITYQATINGQIHQDVITEYIKIVRFYAPNFSTTSTEVCPTPTPTVDRNEDSDHDGTPDWQDSAPNDPNVGGSKPTPIPAP